MGVVLLALIVALAILSRPHHPPMPSDPLAIDPSDIASASLDGTVLAPGSPAFVAARSLPQRLVGVHPSETASWVEPRMLRLGLRDGTTLWVQIMRNGPDATVRVTADGGSTRVQRLRALRLGAFRLPGDSVSAILGEVTGEHGISPNHPDINRLIHKNKARLER